MSTKSYPDQSDSDVGEEVKAAVSMTLERLLVSDDREGDVPLPV